jgi:pimeloyl-ACP methyl ester carboxylesterase
MLCDFDRADDLHRITAPTLVIAAPDDVIIPVDQSRRLAAAIQGARIAELTGGHFFPRVDPGGFASLVGGFLREAS